MSWTPEKLPEDPETERALLATLCSVGNDRVAEECSVMLAEDDFITPAHRALFRAMVNILGKRAEVNALTLKSALESNGELGAVGDFSGLLELLGAEEVGKPMVLVGILKEHSRRRALIRLGSTVVSQAMDASNESSNIVEGCCHDLAALSQQSGDTGLQEIADVTDDALSRIIAQANGDTTFGTRTGFYRFDGLTKGFKPGNLIILAARPAVGKTSLALNWALRSSALKHQGSVAYFSLEMSKEELAGKLLSDLSNVNLHDLTGADREEISRLGDAKMELDSRPILLDDRSETTVRQIRGKVERLQAKSKVSMVVIDYLQLLTSSDITRASSQNEAVRVGDISRALKLMAKDCKIPVIVLSQLNREIEKRSNRTPQLSDLRDSGAIEQDADMVIFIDRKIQPDVSEDLQEKEGKIIIAKHRNGPTGYIPVEWEGQYSRYKEVERQTSNAAPAQWGRQTIDEWV